MSCATPPRLPRPAGHRRGTVPADRRRTYPPAMTSSAPPVDGDLGQARRPRSTADLVVTVVLLLAGAVLAVLASSAGLLLVMAADGCGIQGECSELGLTAGVGAAALGPWAGLLALGAWAVVRLVRRRRAWWTALAAVLAVPVLWAAGAGLVWLSVGGASA
ncbi:DUF6264 family protein [Quadrisphaera sp. KR29]|uniref:DUF6264 family protein n=1 Tax=Quadrisphaera sp. KR29 TaxID=3461391 RepID=UPI004043D790